MVSLTNSAYSIQEPCPDCREGLELGPVWAWLCCYSIPLKSLLGVVVPGGRIRTIPPEVCHFCLPLFIKAELLGSALQTPSSAAATHHLPIPLRCDSKMWFWRVVSTALGCGSEETSEPCRTEPSRVVQSSSRTEPEPSLVQWSSGAAQHRWSHFQGFVWHCFPVIIFHCLGLGDGENQLRGLPTILSFSQQPHGTKSKWQTPSVRKASSFIFLCFCY